VTTATPSRLHLTHLDKVYWPKEKWTKGDLLKYYSDVAPVILPYIRDRAMVMKRYPHGIDGPFFFMKRVPEPHPDWLKTFPIEHESGNIINFPVVTDLASLLWIVNLGCIDLNPWYGRNPKYDVPDYVHFDLDPVKGATFKKVCEAALVVHEALDSLKMPNIAKTTGSRGIHVYVPIVPGPIQKSVWSFSKEFAKTLAARHPKLLTAEYRIAKRPANRVLVDYNQNAWGRTLASVYSVRPKPGALVSAPVTWKEIEKGIRLEDFRIDTMRARLKKVGDLWKPILGKRRFDLGKFI
jgi:bifunctional non-homologous end joining protein LigD